MSGSTRTSADLDPRRRKILFRAWHRGMRETDLIMGRFADAEIGTLSEAELDLFELLIEVLDRDLLSWITGEAQVAVELRHGCVPAAEGVSPARQADPCVRVSALFRPQPSSLVGRLEGCPTISGNQ
jgi:antitoxin CptB